jgi:hypothetical protein
MNPERKLINAMKVLLECTDMDALQGQSDALIGRAIELLAQPEQDLQGQIESGCRVIKDKLNEEPIGEIALSGNTVGIGAPFLAVKWVTGMMPAIGTKLYTSPQNRNPEQEPVAWRWKTHKRNYYTYSEENYHELEGEPLYTAPPKDEPPMTQREMYQRGYAAAERDLKREPLSDDEIMQTTQGMSEFAAAMFKAGVRAAERAYGIGESNELTENSKELDRVSVRAGLRLITSQPEREPMTGKEISQGFRADNDATNAESYWAGVALAKKHHGVTGENK